MKYNFSSDVFKVIHFFYFDVLLERTEIEENMKQLSIFYSNGDKNETTRLSVFRGFNSSLLQLSKVGIGFSIFFALIDQDAIPVNGTLSLRMCNTEENWSPGKLEILKESNLLII